MGLFSFIGDLIGGNKKAKAAKAASDVQAQAAQQGINLIQGNQQIGLDALTGGRDAAITALTGSRDDGIASLLKQMGVNDADLDATLAELKPFIDTGTQALGGQRDLLGLGGNEAQASAIAALKGSPLFQSLFGTGRETILASGSATGGLRGGNMQRSLADFGSDTLAKTIEAQLSRLGGLSAQGVSAADSAGRARLGTGALNSNLAGGIASAQTGTGVNIANAETGTAALINQLLGTSGVNIAQLLGDKGQAQAGGILGKANAYLDMYKSGTGFAGDIASAIMGLPGVGSSQAGQFAAKIL